MSGHLFSFPLGTSSLASDPSLLRDLAALAYSFELLRDVPLRQTGVGDGGVRSIGRGDDLGGGCNGLGSYNKGGTVGSGAGSGADADECVVPEFASP